MKQAVIVPSWNCNLRCRFCEYGDREREPHLERKDLERIADAYRPRRVNLMGGEPLLYPHLEDALEIFPKCTVQTNGLLVRKNGKFIDRVGTVIVSVEGKPSYHDAMRGRGTHKKALEAIDFLNEHSIPVFIRATLSRSSVPQIRYLVSLSKKKAKGLYFFPIIGDHSRFHAEEVAFLFDMFSKYENVWLDLPPYFCYLGVGGKCAAGDARLAFFPTKTIGPCQWMDWYYLGTLDDDPGLVMENAASFARTKVPRHECALCEWSDICKGGCLVVNFPCPLSRMPKHAVERETELTARRGREIKKLLSGVVTC